MLIVIISINGEQPATVIPHYLKVNKTFSNCLSIENVRRGTWLLKTKLTKENSNLGEMFKLFSRRFMSGILPTRCLTQDIQSIDKISTNFYML